MITLDDATVLSTRLYDHATGRLGVFAGEGAVTVTEFSVFSPASDADAARRRRTPHRSTMTPVLPVPTQPRHNQWR